MCDVIVVVLDLAKCLFFITTRQQNSKYFRYHMNSNDGFGDLSLNLSLVHKKKPHAIELTVSHLSFGLWHVKKTLACKKRAIGSVDSCPEDSLACIADGATPSQPQGSWQVTGHQRQSKGHSTKMK